ncbi:MAG: hypothetical protein ACR2ML_05305 [Solirubrobacteraceae bacterium]
MTSNIPGGTMSKHSRRVAFASVCAAVGGTAALAPAAQAQKEVQTVAGCPPVSLEQPFTSFGDARDYVLAPGGAFEEGDAGWALEGGAAVGAGNEPWSVHGAGDASSLSLAEGASATSPPLCVDETYPILRFFRTKESEGRGRLVVHVLPAEGRGRFRAARLVASRDEQGWALTDDVSVADPEGGAKGARDVVLRVTAQRGDWRVDDVYVDPRSRR